MVSRWLQCVFILILGMFLLGGVTRLTRSGLSIVEWKPITGILPPMNETAWQEQFTLYQSSPEYQKINNHFQLEDYKNIFYWEYFHRLLGRILFFVSLVPGIYFWRKKQFPGARTAAIPLLVAAQGLVGWLMVKSGLNIRPHVSHYMLALHFFSAFILALVVLKFRFDLFNNKNRLIIPQKLYRQSLWIGAALVIQIFYGCLVSGLKAGFAFNTYPLMGDQFFPPAGLALDPWWINIFENPTTVQWIHRWWAIVVMTLILVFLKKLWTEYPESKKSVFHLGGILVLQVILGISTLILNVPTSLAATHQMVAALLGCGYFSLLLSLKTK